MKKKIISIFIVAILVSMFLLSYIISYANTDEKIYVNLTKADLNGIGYAIKDPTSPNVGGEPVSSAYIWNLTNYDSNNASDISAAQRNLYCIKANYGDTWNQNSNTIVEYNLSYNLQKDREMLLNKIVDNGNDADDVVKALLNPDNQTGGYYRELLWILDNAYIEGETDKEEFLARIGFKYSAEDDAYFYEQTGSVDYNDLVSTNAQMFGYQKEDFATDADIKAAQKAAIWYYTNYAMDIKNEAVFNQKDQTDWLNISIDNGQSYEELSMITHAVTAEGETRNDQATILYNYLIDEAAANAHLYTEENNYTLTGGAEVDTSNMVPNGDGKYKLQAKRVGSNYVIGPIVIDGNNSSLYEIAIKVTNDNGTDINYTYTDSEGNSLGTTDIKDLVGREEGFYITIPRNAVQKVNIKIDITQETTEKKLWLKGIEETDKIRLESEQPIVELTRTPETITTEFESEPEEFDLALRKFITHLNNVEVTNTRVPNIVLDSLETGTTATYNHRKSPVVIKDKDEVTYQIRIYNEGNKAGYASTIIDQLPTGLISSNNNSLEVVSKDKNGNDKNTYTLEYSPTPNQIKLTIVNTAENPAKSLDAYTTGNLDYETIEIKCKVAQEADEKEQIILTNVAWINEAYNSEDNVEIVNIGQDRDSEPATKPSVNKDNMEDYKGNSSNPDDLSNSNYFYQGEQDDDDFEKLVLMPEEKVFDLSLKKFIAAISKDPIIEDGEYITDNKNADGKYLRAPVVTALRTREEAIATGKDTVDYELDEKLPLLVETGDYVLYTIRVYNEGELDGYASVIKDELPEGLEFVEMADETNEYYGIWNLEDPSNRQVITTNYLAKGQGKELDSQPGDANYTANLLKALNPESGISNDNPDYLDVQVLCKVVEPSTSDRKLINRAQISDDSDSDGNEIEDIDSTPDEWIEGEDDQDIEVIRLECFDLSLRKFITSVNGTELKDSNGLFTRAPVVDVTPLQNGTDTTAIYNHPKTPVELEIGDKVIYTIRVYNEGDINGFANEVKDYLPPYLEYVNDSEINAEYGWQISEDGRIATTRYLEEKEINKFDGTTLDYEDIQIECRISDNAIPNEKITNIAEISEYEYKDVVVPADVDSMSGNMEENLPSDEELPGYKEEQENDEYVPGNEDDDDFEKVYIKEFDLALRKFITQVQDKEVTTRVPEVKIENGNISYEHPKDPITVHIGDVVIYTIRVYNEGDIAGYASEITDDIPEHLEYLPQDNTNVEYMWTMYDENDEITTNVEDAVKIKTNYLSKENGDDNLLQAFDGTTLYYKDIKIAFKVKDPGSNTVIITNHAQISDDTDEDGEDITDKDSTPDEWNEGEDDQDIENVKVEYFDLSLLKFVSKVIIVEDGQEKISETGYNGHEDPEPVVKVELHKKKIEDVVVKFGYGITITNEGDVPGYATEITDYVPEGLKFEASDNPNWTDEGNNVISTKQLENTLLQPGESATVEVILTWINGEDNLALKTNIAEISEDDNEFDVPDKDSTPDNQKDGEDDIDLAKVILAIETGKAKTYFTLTLGLLSVVTVGIILIKKYVI